MVDVVSDQTELSYAESLTGWSGDSFVQDTEILVQGTASNSCIQTANGINDVIFTKATGTWDFTGGVTIRMYLNSNITANMQTEASNGIQIFITGGSTAYFTVSGKDTYKGGWQDFFLDTSITPTSGSFTANAVTAVGIRINTATKPRNAINGWFDNWRFGDGLEINSDTTEAIDFADVATEDGLIANKYDIIEENEENYFCKGKLTLGNAAGSKNCNLVSVNESLTFIDRNIASDLYGIIGTEGTGATDISLSGFSCKTNGTSGAEFDFSATITSFAMTGASLASMGLVKFAQGTVDLSSFTLCGATTLSGSVDVAGCTWTSSATVTMSGTSSADLCNFLPLTSVTAVSTDDLAKLTGCTFTSGGTGHAVELTALGSGTMSWDNQLSGYATSDGSTGNESIYVNVGSGTLTINVAAGASTPYIRTAGAVVTVVSGQVDFKFTVSPSITGYEWRLYVKDPTQGTIGSSELDGEETATLDNQTYSYTYGSDIDAALQIIASGYEESVTYHTLSSLDQDLTITLNTENNT